MSLKVEISNQELNTRKSNGAVFLCKSCKDNLNKNVMLEYNPTGAKGIYYRFCIDCLNAIKECIPCNLKK